MYILASTRVCCKYLISASCLSTQLKQSRYRLAFIRLLFDAYSLTVIFYLHSINYRFFFTKNTQKLSCHCQMNVCDIIRYRFIGSITWLKLKVVRPKYEITSLAYKFFIYHDFFSHTLYINFGILMLSTWMPNASFCSQIHGQ